MLNTEFKKEWVAALRSGDYQQGIGELKDASGKYCCLGVACDLLVKKGLAVEGTKNGVITFDLIGYNNAEWCVLPKSIAEYLGTGKDPIVTNNHEEDSLSGLNDNGMSFKKIATLIEEQL